MKNKIVSKALAGVLSAATLTGSVVSGVEVKACYPQVTSYNNAGLSSSKKILLTAGAAGIAGVGIPFIVGGAILYNDHLKDKSKSKKQWKKLKLLTDERFTNNLDDAIKLIYEIANGTYTYEYNKLLWASRVAEFKIIFDEFFRNINSKRSKIQCYGNLKSQKMNAFGLLYKVESHFSSNNGISYLFYCLDSCLNSNSREGTIAMAGILMNQLISFKKDFENLKNALYTL